MKLRKILNSAKYFTIAVISSLALFACQEEETEITNPKPSDILEVNSELTNLISRTVSSEDSEENIECIDFEYPISISIFDTSFDIADTESIDSDTEFSSFIDTLDDDVIASLSYPLTVNYSDQTTDELNSNQALVTAISESIDTCGDPVTVQDCTQASTAANLTECIWTIIGYVPNELNEEYTIIFSENGSLTINDDTDVAYGGTWEVFEEGDQLMFNIASDIIEFTWQIVECGDDYLQASGDNESILITRDCEEDTDPVTVQDCTQTSTVANLSECLWNINSYSPNEVYENYTIIFSENGSLTINDDTDKAFGGTWEVFEEGDQLMLQLESRLIDFTWQIVECGDDYLQASGDNDTILINRDCEEDAEPVSTEEENAATVLLSSCTWFMDRYTVDDESFFADYVGSSFEFYEDGTFIFNDPTTFYNGTWTIDTNAVGDLIIILEPTQSLPNYINYTFTIDTIRDGFTEWSAYNTMQQEIGTAFEGDCN